MAKTRPHVLIVSQHDYPFHPILRRNVAELLSLGTRVDLVCLASYWRPPSHPQLRIYSLPIRMRQARAVLFPIYYLMFLAWAFGLVSLLALQRRYDVVQVDTTPDILIFAALVPRRRRMPVVLYLMELMPELAAARLRRSPSSRSVRLAVALERAATRRADRVITVSNLVSRTLIARGLDPAKVTVVPNSHDLQGVGPTGPATPPFLVIQTTLIRRYGVHVAIEAFAKLASAFPALTLEIIGDGEERSALMRLAHTLRLSDRVVFSDGFVPWDRAMDRVRQATLGIAPILADGYGDLLLPTKILEFAALQIPMVCSRLPSIEEHFPPDAVAYFEPGDAVGLAAQLARLLGDPASAREQARRARVAMTELSWESAATRYLDVLGITGTRARPSREEAGAMGALAQ
jgi:glycosyltransferase involved in cell wall biosynthesis